MLARLGRTTLAAPWLVIVGALCWNLGVAAGVWGILPAAAPALRTWKCRPTRRRLVFLGYLMIVVWGVLTFHQRRERQLFVSQWFLFAALFWFPWIYSTANLLLLTLPRAGHGAGGDRLVVFR